MNSGGDGSERKLAADERGYTQIRIRTNTDLEKTTVNQIMAFLFCFDPRKSAFIRG